MPAINVDVRLAELGMALPPAPKPVAAYIPAVKSGNLVFVSGQLPMRDGRLLASGPMGEQTLEAAQEAAGQCVLNALAVLKDELAGDWSRLVRIVRVAVFVQCPDRYADQPKVANGASELLVKILGDSGRHVRVAVGVNALPLDATVEVELTAEVR